LDFIVKVIWPGYVKRALSMPFNLSLCKLQTVIST